MQLISSTLIDNLPTPPDSFLTIYDAFGETSTHSQRLSKIPNPYKLELKNLLSNDAKHTIVGQYLTCDKSFDSTIVPLRMAKDLGVNTTIFFK